MTCCGPVLVSSALRVAALNFPSIGSRASGQLTVATGVSKLGGHPAGGVSMANPGAVQIASTYGCLAISRASSQVSPIPYALTVAVGCPNGGSTSAPTLPVATT